MSKASELQRLLNNTPSPAHANATIRLAGFVDAIEQFDLRHVQRGVSMILNSEVPEINPAYAIYPPMLVSICRQLRDRELTHDATTRGAILQITARDEVFHEDPPQLRKMAVQEALAKSVVVNPKIAGQTPEEIAAREAVTKSYLAKHDGFFIDPSPEAMRKRLHI